MPYRLLKIGEIIKITDEFQREDGSWGFLADCACFDPNKKYGGKFYPSHRKYRRVTKRVIKNFSAREKTLRNCLRNAKDTIMLMESRVLNKEIRKIAHRQIENIDSVLK